MKTLREIFKRRKKPYERMETLNLNEIYVTRKEYNTMMEMLGQIAGKSIDLHDFHLSQAGLLRDVVLATNQQTVAIEKLLTLVDGLSSRIDRYDLEETTLAEDLRKEKLPVEMKLRTPIHELELSARAYNCLKALEIYDVANLACQRRDALTACRNLGRKCLREMETALKSMGLHLGMDLSEYGYVQTDGILARATDIIHVKKNTVDAEP